MPIFESKQPHAAAFKDALPFHGTGAGGASAAKQSNEHTMNIDFTIPADLYLGSDPATARAQGHRHFSTTEAAIRFAMEQAAPVSLRGALLRSGARWFSGDDIRRLYNSDMRFRRQFVPEVAALNAA